MDSHLRGVSFPRFGSRCAEPSPARGQAQALLVQQIPRVLLLQPELKFFHQFVEVFGGWLRAELFDRPPQQLALTDAEVVGFAVTTTGEGLEQFLCDDVAQVSSLVFRVSDLRPEPR